MYRSSRGIRDPSRLDGLLLQHEDLVVGEGKIEGRAVVFLNDDAHPPLSALWWGRDNARNLCIL
jgi:hypothetical protein